MSKSLLVRYIKTVLDEVADARVPTQLLQNSDSEKKEEEAEDVNEFSGAGAVAGYTAPLGMSADDLGRKKNKPNHKK